MPLPSPSLLTSLTLSVSKGSPPNVVTYQQDIPLSGVNMGNNSIPIPPTSSIFSAFETASVGTSFNYSLNASYAAISGPNVVITTPGAQPFVPPPPPPIVLDANGVTIKYTGLPLTSTTTPVFIQANPRGTGMEWFAVVNYNFKQKISGYANSSSGNYAAAVATFTPPGQSSPVIFNNIVTTLMTDMSSIFESIPSFNSPINSWDMSNVISMDRMFTGASNFNQDISKWNVSKVKNMSNMFYLAEMFNQPINYDSTTESWNVLNVENMDNMFNYAHKFNRNISNWNVGNVRSMIVMFQNAYKFNQDISNWDVGNVTNMLGMFYNAYDFNKDISNWNVANVTSFAFFAVGSGLSLSYTPPKFR
jgi:hypothetical protein